jgi:signal transduction histidine kinase/CheY-like chemotaxis protein
MRHLESLKTLLWVYPLLLFLNAAIAVALWAIYRKSIFGLLVAVWISTLVNFVAQGAALNSPLFSVLTFSSYVVTAWFLCKILAQTAIMPFGFRPFWLVFALAFVITLILYNLGLSFTWFALPLALAVAAPQIIIACKVLVKKQEQRLNHLFALVLLINGLHFIDYPFLRPLPEAAVFGYSVVIATSMLFGVLLPCIINNFLANILTLKLRNEIRNREIIAEELEIALASAERASRAKTTFLANMSHHLRTPINGIVGMNDLLLESHLNQPQQLLARQLSASSHELLSMIDNVLTTALLESEKVKLYPKAFSIQALVNDIFDHYAANTFGKFRLINRAHSSNSRWILADSLKIKQICLNLIDNSIKHSQGQTANFSIELNDFNELLIILEDDGVGIPTHRQLNLTVPFEQEFESFHGGVGLGLSIVKSLTELMSGDVQIESAPNKGVRVECRIPVSAIEGELVAASPAALSAMVDEKHAQPNSLAANVDTLKNANANQFVLVVEDNPVNCMVIGGMLKKLSINFTIAETGAKAMELYAEYKNNLSCILMDVQLPDANGLELVEKIRAGGDGVPVLVISAFAFGCDEDLALKKGANDYLRKPYHFIQFKNALSQLGVQIGATAPQ